MFIYKTNTKIIYLLTIKTKFKRMKKLFTFIAAAAMALTVNAQSTIYSWEGGEEGATEVGGKASASDADGADTTADDINMANSTFKCIRLRGAKDFSTFTVTLTLDKELSAGDKINITAHRNKDVAGKKSGALLKFEKGETQVATDTNDGLEFVNVNAAVKGTSEYSTTPNTVTLVVPDDAAGSKVITMTRAQTATNLFISKIEIVSTAAAATETWTVAGVGTILGSTWDPTDTSNDMTSTDGKNYTLVKENCTLEQGTSYEFKVVKDHAWTEAYPGSNASLTVNETAIYKVTFTFNSETKEVSAAAVKTGEASAVEHTYDVKGNFFNDTNWEKVYPMTKGNDGNWTVTIDGLEAGNYEFKVRQDNSWDVSYPASNYQVAIEAVSTLTIKFFPESKTIETTVAPTTAISTVKAAQQTAEIYNLAGQKVSDSYKGVVIMNGKKVVIK